MEADAPPDLPSIPALDDASKLPDFDRGNRFIALLPSIGVEIRGRSVADLGAGYGSVSLAAALAGATKVHALDANAQRLADVATRAERRRANTVETLRANLLDPLPIDPVDVALLIGVVEYAGLWDEACAPRDLQLQLFRRVHAALKPGGVLVVGTKNRLWPRYIIDDAHTRQPFVNCLPRDWADAASNRLTGAPYRHHIHAPREWTRLLRSAGFISTRVFYPYFSYQFPLRMVERPRPTDLRDIAEMPLSPEEDRVARGPRWRLKALLMLASRMGVPLTQSLVIVATK